MGKYYVAGIPFDSENSLQHYGVKGMEWNKHKFGIDADDRYIKWLKNAGQNIGRFANNAAQNVAKGATAAAKTVSTAVNKGANFVTGNQDRQNAAAKRSEARTYNQRAANPVRSMGYASDTKTARPSQWFNKDAGLTGRDYSQQIADQQRVYASKAAKANQEANEYEKRANNAVIPTVNRTANAVGNRAGQAAQNAGDWAKGAAQKVADVALWPATREDVANAAENVGNAVGQAAQNVGNAVSDAANKASEGAKGFLNSAGQWVSGAANNVKNTASKAVSDASKGASGFLNSAGQWVSNAAGNAKNAVGEATKAVGDTVGQAAQDVGKAVSNAAQNVSNTVGQAAEQARGGIGGFFDRVGNAVGGAAKDVGNWAGQAAQDVGGAVQNAGEWVGDRARDVGQAVANVPQNVANWYTGQPHADRSNMLRTVQDDKMATANRMMDLGTNMIGQSFDAEPPWGMSPDSSAYAQKAKDDSKRMFNAGLDVRNAGYDKMREAYAMNSPIHDADERYKSAPRQVLNSAGDWIGDRVSDVGGAVSGAVNAVGDWTRNAAENVGDWARDASRNTARNFSDAVGNVGLTANQNNFPMGGTLKEQYIQEERIPEQLIPEKRISEQRISEQKTRELNPGQQKQVDYWSGVIQNRLDNFDDYYNNLVSLPQFKNYTRQDVMNDLLEQKDYWQNRAYREDMFHSALSDKPEGVSDAFWEKFTADGGTREEYERDWR